MNYHYHVKFHKLYFTSCLRSQYKLMALGKGDMYIDIFSELCFLRI